MNNAGIAHPKKGNTTPEKAEESVMTNFTGTMGFTDEILDHIVDNGKIIFVTGCVSRGGYIGLSPTLKEKFTEGNTLTMEQLMELKDLYLANVHEGINRKKGWGAWEYEISKLFNEVGCKILGRSEKVLERGIQCYSCHPGMLKTDMTAWMGNSKFPAVETGTRLLIELIEKEFKINPTEQGGYFDEDGSYLELKGKLGKKY